MYGPTEATVFATYQVVKKEDCHQPVSQIGVWIPDLRVYVLDANGQPVLIGAVGELYIGGPGVARGYLNKPELTAKRFLPDPFMGISNECMYKTGDLVQYLPDHSLAFMGRNDDQVKICSFWIELGEIEAHLIGHPNVRDASVLLLGKESNH